MFVSDEHGGVDAVIDAATNKLIENIPLGGGAGNTVYDPFWSLWSRSTVSIYGPSSTPRPIRLSTAYSFPASQPAGISLDTVERKAFVAGEENHSLAMIDLKTMKVRPTTKWVKIPMFSPTIRS